MTTKQKKIILIIVFQVLGLFFWGIFLHGADGFFSSANNLLCLPGILVLRLIGLIMNPGIKIIAVIFSLLICPIMQVAVYTVIDWIIAELIYSNKKTLSGKLPQK